MSALPPASEKLRTVLDYVPCEACLAERVQEQELLCSICHRLDREVGVRIGVATTVLLERPNAAPALPVVIPPAGAPTLPAVAVRYLERGERPKKENRGESGVIDVFVEPFDEAAPIVAVASTPAQVAEPAHHHIEFEDIAWYEPPSDAFEYTGPAIIRTSEPAAPPAERAVLPEDEPVIEDDFVFRPPPQEEPVEVAPRPEPPVRDLEEDWMPSEEVAVRSETTDAEAQRWARPPSARDEEPILEEVPVAAAAPEFIEVPPLEATVVEEEEIIQETTMVEEAPPAAEPDPAPEVAAAGDLWRLRGFDINAERALAAANIKELSHLSGHDATELASRTGLDARRLSAWIDVADLKEEIGVPVEAALSLVAAGIAGPRGLRDTDAEDVVAKVDAFGGGAGVHLKDVKRWKRRA